MQDHSNSRSAGSKAVRLEGEILDPKCWFGVMKPGEGKVHKSCAIRCISGGIPPVFKVKAGSQNTYYVLKSANDQNINQEVLPYVAEAVAIAGTTFVQNGWNVLEIDMTGVEYLD